MKKIVRMSIAAAMLTGLGSVSAQAEGLSVFDNVSVKGEIRPRYEMVEQDTKNNANAFTNRLTIGVNAGLFGTDWMSTYLEMTNVSNINDNYNSSANGQTDHALVKDPEQTRVTQSYIDLKAGGAKLRLGRQMINLDNQRFIGAVGWRQMFQTFDGSSLTYNGIENLNIFAAFLTQVNTVGTGSNDAEDLLVNVSYKAADALKVTAYSYMLGSVHDTYGLALTGKVKVSDGMAVSYRAEYATQSDASIDRNGGTTNVKADADYMRFDVGLNMSGILLGAGYEVLSGDDDGAGTGSSNFTTPYSTLHGKNGWADVFLPNGGSPEEGLEDMSLYVGYKAKGFGLAKVIYHDFSSDVGSIDYGSEVNAIYKNAIPGVKGLSGMIKYAKYSADDAVGGTSVDTTLDTEKLWLMLDYKFSSK